ncbi:MAG: response regulator transcription factor [Bacteroidales bacterium]|nr:response regulator transcription factor [Bacteroidales bacterium]
MTCIIIEDEKIAAERLKDMLNAYDPSIQVLKIIQSTKQAIEVLKNPDPADLLFMDILLADGLCFEIFEQVEVKTPIIFTTAYDEYALKAFKLNSIDYLLKPIDDEELHKAIEKFRSSIYHQKYSYSKEIIDKVVLSLQGNYKTKFVIKVGEHLKIIPIEEVTCFFSLERATFLQTAGKRDYAINYSLEQLEEILDPKVFFRINRQYIIALSSIHDIIAYTNSRLKLKLKNLENHEIIVSRERVQQFREWIEG